MHESTLKRGSKMTILVILIISLGVSVFVGACIRVANEEQKFVPQGRAHYVNGKWRVGK